MKKNRFLCFLITIVMTFTTALSFSSEVEAKKISEYSVEELRKEFQTNNPFELTLCEMSLKFGDFFMEYLTFLFKEEITVQKIIYNKVDALNADFFRNNITNKNEAPATKFVVEAVNRWYNVLKQLVIVIYMASILVVGIKALTGGPNSLAQAKELFVKWIFGIALLFFFPFLMKYGFVLNDTIILAMDSRYGGSNGLGNYVGAVSDLTRENLEFRSPKYVTRGTYILSAGSEEATMGYINRIEEYSARGDMMRLIRSLAGITSKIMYVVLWYIMIWQLLIFIYVYYKRYLIIAFLIIIFPITMIEYIVGIMLSGKPSSLSAWSKEFFMNVFLQSVHACIYSVISGVVMGQIMAGFNEGDLGKVNWFLLICSINFVFVAEKMLASIINAAADTIESPGDVSKKARGGAITGFKKTKKTLDDLSG